MKFKIGDLNVSFPYDAVYPEQFEYMTELKKLLEQDGHAILEMPTGTGKTVCLLSLILSFIKQKEQNFKLVYCTRTIVEMEKTMEELKFVHGQRKKDFGPSETDILALCLSSRRNLCIHEQVSKEDEREKVDSMCRRKTAFNDIENLGDRCNYYDNYIEKSDQFKFPADIYTLDDLKELGRKVNMCPYFLARKFLLQANVIVYNYAYLLDPKIANLVSSELQKDCIVVFDECHNIDNACIEALSMNFNRKTLEVAGQNLRDLENKIAEEKEIGKNRLEEEYKSLVHRLADKKVITSEQEMLSNPILQQEVTAESIPGNMRKATHFLPVLRKLIVYFKDLLNSRELIMESPLNLVYKLQEKYYIDQRTLKFTAQRLHILMNTLQIANIDQYSSLNVVANMATLISTYYKGFVVIIEPYPEDQLLHDPRLQFYCLDASLATEPVFKKFRNVILTSGTISPMKVYQRILNFTPRIMKAFQIHLPRNAIQPVIMTKGADQLPVSSKFDERENTGVVRNYGSLLIELSGIVPDGMVCFFTSYKYMEHVIVKWNEMGILQKVLENKLIFIETKDNLETVLALENYKQACDNGRGAVFFSIARGKVSEGVDFAGHYGRAVVVFGIPFQNTLSRNLRARMQFLNETYNIQDQDFLTFDAMRQTSQCVGRVLRSKYDYGMMIFADKRYKRKDFTDKMPEWIRHQLFSQKNECHKDLSTDITVQVASNFFKEMGQHDFIMPKNMLYDAERIASIQKEEEERQRQVEIANGFLPQAEGQVSGGDVVMNNGETQQIDTNQQQQLANGQQIQQNGSNLPTTNQQVITLSDETLVNGTRWDVLKVNGAMAEDYQSQQWYQVINQIEHQLILEMLREAQKNQRNMAPLEPQQRYI